MGRRPQPVRDRVVSIGDGPLLSYKLSKVWRVHVWQNYNEKTDFHVQLFIGVIPSHKESPNFCHVISQLKTTLNWKHIVPDRQGSAAHEIPNHWISSRLKDQNFKSLHVYFATLMLKDTNWRHWVMFKVRIGYFMLPGIWWWRML